MHSSGFGIGERPQRKQQQQQIEHMQKTRGKEEDLYDTGTDKECSM